MNEQMIHTPRSLNFIQSIPFIKKHVKVVEKYDDLKVSPRPSAN